MLKRSIILSGICGILNFTALGLWDNRKIMMQVSFGGTRMLSNSNNTTTHPKFMSMRQQLSFEFDALSRFDETCHLGNSYNDWFEQKIPVLKTIFHAHKTATESRNTNIRTNNIGILLTTKHLTAGGPRKRRERYNIWAHRQQWFCTGDSDNYDHSNSSSSSSPSLARLVGTGDHHGHTIVLECPLTVTTLHSLVSNGPGGNITYGNLTDFYNCQTKEHPINTIPSNLTFVAQTMLAFAPARRMLPSWIEYHRAIMGIQHFIVYVNEPWATFSSNRAYFYHPSYVTYVPFRESFGLNQYKFQQAAQTDALHRLKGSSVEWVAMMDVDEYFQVSPIATSTFLKGEGTGALLQLLRQQLAISGDEELAAFVVSAHLFGYHPQRSMPLLKDIPICSQFGRSPTEGGIKPIVRPSQTNYVSVHEVSGGEKQIPLDPTTTGLRYGHFHAERAKFEEVVLDESFGHQACDVVLQELQTYFPSYKDDNRTVPPDLYAYDTEQDAGSRVILSNN